jgi:glyceraldehyde 3-phosphate dehydrogenase
MTKVKVGINGFGRIGRAFLREAMDRDDVEVVAINDLGNIENLAYLLQYDTVYKRADFTVSADVLGSQIVLNKGGVETKVKFYSQKMPDLIAWKEADVNVVIEATGFFTKFEDAKLHLKGGAKKVVISAPAKDEPLDMTQATILLGVNEDKLAQCIVTSNASCTTNAASPLIAILSEAIGVEKALLSTTHGYTASQSLVDGPNKKDFREGRAAAQNIVPSSTGAAIAVTKAFPALSGLFDGISLRVPVPAGSIVDVTFIAKRDTTKEEVNEILKKSSKLDKWAGIFSVTEEDLVSSDILGAKYASIADLQFTRVVGGNLVKVLAWYDNEAGYTHTLVDHAVKLGR